MAMFACSTFGRPSVSCFHVVPPSVDLKMPLPPPPKPPPSQNACCCCHSVAYTVLGSLGSMRTSLPLVYSSRYSTFWNDLPPSVERKMPRSALGPYGCPSTATNSRFGSRGSTSIIAIIRLSYRPRCVHVLPASVDL